MILSRTSFIALALSSVVLVVAGVPQDGQKLKIPPKLPPLAQKMIHIDKPGSSDWRVSSVSPKLLLAKGDSWLANLKDASAKLRFVFSVGEQGSFGVLTGDLAVVNARKYRADYGHVFRTKGEVDFHHSFLYSDGSQEQKYDETGFSVPRPTTAPRLPKQLLAAWVERYQDLIFTEYGSQERPLSALYDAAKAAGLRATTEQRSYLYNKQKFSQYRVVLSGTAKFSGKAANYGTEILIDAPTNGLVKITQFRQFGKDVTTEYRSYLALLWDRTPGQKFDPKLFEIASVTASASPPARAN